MTCYTKKFHYDTAKTTDYWTVVTGLYKNSTEAVQE